MMALFHKIALWVFLHQPAGFFGYVVECPEDEMVVTDDMVKYMRAQNIPWRWIDMDTAPFRAERILLRSKADVTKLMLAYDFKYHFRLTHHVNRTRKQLFRP